MAVQIFIIKEVHSFLHVLTPHTPPVVGQFAPENKHNSMPLSQATNNFIPQPFQEALIIVVYQGSLKRHLIFYDVAL